jgi:hypothetical protein
VTGGVGLDVSVIPSCRVGDAADGCHRHHATNDPAPRGLFLGWRRRDAKLRLNLLEALVGDHVAEVLFASSFGDCRL